jgi:GNAT superfamily N-acetyltransferase
MNRAQRAKRELFEDYPPGDFKDSIAIGPATVCLRLHGDILFLTSIHVMKERRGEGHGGRALSAVLAACDKYRCVCRLEVRPFDGNRSKRKLFDWYGRFGFEPTSGAFMRRQPRSKT